MWYAKKGAYEVFVFLNGKTFLLPIERCKSIFYTENKFYFLCENDIRCYDENFRFLFQTYNVERNCNRIYVDRYFIYTSSPDTGAVYQYALNGTLLQSVRAGEHVGDFTLAGEALYTVSYHDNKLFQIKNMEIVKDVFLDEMPQTVLFDKNIFVLLNNEFYSCIELFNDQLELIKKISMPRQIGELFLWKNKLVFCGCELNYVLDENLKFLSIKKSTGKLLCRYSDDLLYCDDMVRKFDPINNLSYPL